MVFEACVKLLVVFNVMKCPDSLFASDRVLTPDDRKPGNDYQEQKLETAIWVSTENGSAVAFGSEGDRRLLDVYQIQEDE